LFIVAGTFAKVFIALIVPEQSAALAQKFSFIFFSNVPNNGYKQNGEKK